MMYSDGQNRMLVYGRHYSRQLADLLSGLSHRGRITFVASCAQRLLPWINYFRIEAHLPRDAIADTALAAVWKRLEFPDNGQTAIIDPFEILERVAPETEDHSERSTSFCLSAASAVCGAVSLCRSDSIEIAIEAAKMTTDTIDLWAVSFGLVDPSTPKSLNPLLPYPGEIVGRDFKERNRWQLGMERHPRILRELALQFADIRELTEDRDVSTATIKRIRDRSAAAVVIPFPDDPIWLAMKELERQHGG